MQGQGPHVSTLLLALVAAGMIGLAGCDLLKSQATVPAARPADAAAAAPYVASAASAELRRYYSTAQAGLLSQGLMRTDGGQRDAPFTDRMLAENFIRIAAFDEFKSGLKGQIQAETPSTIRRWEIPVRVGLRFGASVPPAMRIADTARVSAYVARLARVSRHPVRMDNTNPNFIVEIVDEDERKALGPVAKAALKNATDADIAGIVNMPRSTFCLVYAQSDRKDSTYTGAFAVIRAEHPDLLRLLCLHEEIAQGLGLANDSPQARPSIFNDNEEFALLTPQDELMLRMLYDPSLSPGMTAEQARPIAQTLATRLLGGES